MPLVAAPSPPRDGGRCGVRDERCGVMCLCYFCGCCCGCCCGLLYSSCLFRCGRCSILIQPVEDTATMAGQRHTRCHMPHIIFRRHDGRMARAGVRLVARTKLGMRLYSM